MPETLTNCNQCPKRCPLTAPGCGRGKRLTQELRGEAPPSQEEHRHHEHHEHGHHGHEHGHHQREKENDLVNSTEPLDRKTASRTQSK